MSCLQYEPTSMGLFDKLFKTTKVETKGIFADSEIEQRNKEFMVKFEQAKNLFIDSLNIYNSKSCQCAFPRFQQMVGIDCSDTGNSFKCYDTDLLISVTKDCFDITESNLNDEVTNEKWICKKCNTTYEFGWSDFSIYVDRQKLKLTNLKTELIGLPTTKPIPLYLGLAGHSYPSKEEITNVSFDEFRKYNDLNSEVLTGNQQRRKLKIKF
jgi:hypothetical protein